MAQTPRPPRHPTQPCLSLQHKLTALLVSVAGVPLALASLALHSSGEELVHDVEGHASRALRDQALAQLRSVAAGARVALQSYADGVVAQVALLCSNQALAEALPALAQASRDFPSGPVDDASLAAFYRDCFDPQYHRLNPDRTAPGARAIFAALDGPARALQAAYLAENPHALGDKDELSADSRGSAYSALHARWHPELRGMLAAGGFYDVFLVEPAEGRVVYSVFKEVDFGTSLLSGPFRDSGLAETFRAALALEPGAWAATDYACYPPSYEAPAAFLGAKLSGGLGVVVVQLPLDRLGQVLAHRDSLGQSGDFYLVGSDRLPRSAPRFEAERFGLDAAFRHPSHARFRHPAALAAAAGAEGAVDGQSYHGGEVLAWTEPLSLFRQRLGFVAELSRDEALAPIAALSEHATASLARQARQSFIGFSAVIAAVAVLALALARRATRPIVAAAELLDDVARGRLDKRLQVASKDEVGRMAQAIGAALDGFEDTISAIERASSELDGGAAQLARTSGAMSRTTETVESEARAVAASVAEVSQSVELIAAAVEQMSASANEIARNAEDAVRTAHAGSTRAGAAHRIVGELSAASASIEEVVGLITEIAEQTNLLALNATIEAARAGEQGRGFAVVAGEVKNLAGETSRATHSIADKVHGIQASATAAAAALSAVAGSIHSISERQSSIASAVEEQTTTIAGLGERLRRAVTEMTAVTGNTARISASIASGTGEAHAVENATLELTCTAKELSRLLERYECHTPTPR